METPPMGRGVTALLNKTFLKTYTLRVFFLQSVKNAWVISPVLSFLNVLFPQIGPTGKQSTTIPTWAVHFWLSGLLRCQASLP